MRCLLAILACAACTTSLESLPPDSSTSSDSSGPDSDQPLPAFVVVTKFGHELIRSVTVHKNGGEDRTVYVENARIAQYPSSGTLPDGARLIMEVSNGGCFVIEKVTGTWLYGSFSCGSTAVTFTTQPNNGCSGCHGTATEPGVFTSPSLRRLVATHVGEEIDCPRGPGPTPCDPSVYQ